MTTNAEREQQNIYNHQRIKKIAEISKNMVKEKYRGLTIKAVPTNQGMTEFNTVIVRYDNGNNVFLVATGGIRDTEKE
jgi:hypothetical protein